MEICLFFLLEDRKALGNSGVGNCIDLSQVADGIIKYNDGFEYIIIEKTLLNLKICATFKNHQQLAISRNIDQFR